MPTKRTRRTRRRTQGPGFNADDIHSWINFLSGAGHPGERFMPYKSRWATWLDFVEDYCAIRSDFLKQVAAGRDNPPWAERFLAVLQEGVPAHEVQKRLRGPYPDDDRYRWNLDGMERAIVIATAPGAPDFIGTVDGWVPPPEPDQS